LKYWLVSNLATTPFTVANILLLTRGLTSFAPPDQQERIMLCIARATQVLLANELVKIRRGVQWPLCDGWDRNLSRGSALVTSAKSDSLSLASSLATAPRWTSSSVVNWYFPEMPIHYRPFREERILQTRNECQNVTAMDQNGCNSRMRHRVVISEP
jgi:hypothetical protein